MFQVNDEDFQKQIEQYREIVTRSFAILDKEIQLFNKHANDSTFARVCGLILVKCKYLFKAINILIWEGLGQESGALLRPAIEYSEALVYLTEDPKRIQRFLNDKLPPAGEIAKIIDGKFKELREHLNEFASHEKISYYSMTHLVNMETGELYSEPIVDASVVKTNLLLLSGFIKYAALVGLETLKKYLEVPDGLENEIKLLEQKIVSLYDTLQK
jgi:hypothetical protein